MPILNLGPTQAFLDYVAGSGEEQAHPVKVALLTRAVTPLSFTTSIKSVEGFFCPRWRWRWPFFTGHRPSVVNPSITSASEGSYMVTLPEYTWPRASVDSGGYIYYLDDGGERPILFARIYPPDGGLTTTLSDATVQSLGFCFHIR